MRITIRNKVLAVFIVLTMILGIIPPIALPVKAADTWDGTANTAWYTENMSSTLFTINTAEELAGLADIVNSGTYAFAGATITLTADLDLSGHNWTSIGQDPPFSGTFDGDGYTISNMTMGTVSSPY